MFDIVLLLEIIYAIIVVIVCIKIIFDTTQPTKSIAYILFILLVPIIGIVFYFMVGFNYRKHEIYSKKIIFDKEQLNTVTQKIESYANTYGPKFKKSFPYEAIGLSNMIYNDIGVVNTLHNKVKLLINGEEKYKELIQTLKKARHHIHIEYYIFENDDMGNEIKDVLIAKAKEGVEVRMVYDDFGSQSIRKSFVKELQRNNIDVFPFYEIRFINFANRLNYRNHRKIVVVDGYIGFVGGINIGNNYNNNFNNNKFFWRDTHLKIEGESVAFLQHIFIADWNFCSGKQLELKQEYFKIDEDNVNADTWVQIVQSGPDSINPSIYYSYLHAIHAAKKRLLITTPYFIPATDFIAALKMAVLRNVEVTVLLPKKGDSIFVNTASQAIYKDLLEGGIKVYRYTKGFIHAKTIVVDDYISMVGTSNIDNRSFNLNFEVNSVVYDKDFTEKLADSFHNDLKDATILTLDEWNKRPIYLKMIQKIAKLCSPLL